MSSLKRILFLCPSLRSDFYFTEFPVGIGYLEEMSEGMNLEVEIFDMNLGYSLESLRRRIKKSKPDIIATQMYSARYKKAYKVFEILKESFSDITIVVGGAHPSIFKEKVLEDCKAIDFAVYGEGEIPFVKFCSGVTPDQIPRFIYRKNGRVISNPPSEYIADLDSLPFPRYGKFELEKFSKHTLNKVLKISICGSRGCPYQCVYCDSGSIMGKRYRYRSIENILDEIEYWYSRGMRAFSFVDDGFTSKASRVFDFCDGVERRKLYGCALSCDNGLRADQVTREMLARMREVGFWRVCVGVESGNPKVLKLLQKGEKIEQIRKTIKNLTELNYNVMLSFLVGSPGETMKDLEDSFRLALEFPVDSAAFNNIIPYPHTRLFEYLESNRLLLKKPEDYLDSDPRHKNEPIFETPEIPRARRKFALKRAFAVERKVAELGMKRRLRKLGIIGKVFAEFYGIPSIRSWIMSNSLFRKLVLEPVKKKVGAR